MFKIHEHVNKIQKTNIDQTDQRLTYKSRNVIDFYCIILIYNSLLKIKMTYHVKLLLYGMKVYEGMRIR